jgi:hypothetical protein
MEGHCAKTVPLHTRDRLDTLSGDILDVGRVLLVATLPQVDDRLQRVVLVLFAVHLYVRACIVRESKVAKGIV